MYVLCLHNKTLAFDIFGLLNSCRTSNECIVFPTTTEVL